MAVLWPDHRSRAGGLLRVRSVQSPVCSSRAEHRIGAVESGGSETSTSGCCADRSCPESDGACMRCCRHGELGILYTMLTGSAD